MAEEKEVVRAQIQRLAIARVGVLGG